MWPDLSVRTWRGVLSSREPHEWDDGEHNYAVEAEFARHLHELRGLMMAQVAEIEDLLRTVLREADERLPGWDGKEPRKKKPRKGEEEDDEKVKERKITTGGALRLIKILLEKLEPNHRLGTSVEKVDAVIKRRNRLVHSRVHVGTSRLGPGALDEPVIALLIDHDATRQAPETENDSLDGDIGEQELTLEIFNAYEALEAAVDIWQAVDGKLPPMKYDEKRYGRS